MDILLDTHVFLWWDSDDPALSAAARGRIADPDNSIYVSAGSIWEIAIKSRRKKLTFAGSPLNAVSANGFIPLPMGAADAERAGTLDWEHRDPFDRMLVAQCLNGKLTLVTADEVMRQRADVPQIWAR